MFASPARQTNRIAYIDSHGQLCTIAPDGGSQQTLTDGAPIFQFPTWSPSGTTIAAIGSDQASSAIYTIADQPGAALRQVYASAARRPFYCYWSPDSRTISFLANDREAGMGLYLAAADGSDPRLLTLGAPCFWEWAPTGDRLLTHTGMTGDDGALLFLLPDGTALPAGPAGTHIRPGLFQTPGIAPGGRFWGFSEVDQSGHTSLVVTGPSPESRVAVPQPGAVALGWSPTRNVLAFIGPTDAARHWYGPLQLLNAETRALRTLVEDPVLGFFWAPDGQSIAYLTVGVTPVADEPSGPPPSVGYTNGNGSHAPPSRARTSQVRFNLWTVHVVSGRKRLLLPFQPTELFLNQMLPFFDQYARSHRLWAPDSSALTLAVSEGGRAQILVIPADGREPHRLAAGQIAFWSHG